MRPNNRKGKEPTHPWAAIAEWAGWRKGKVAAKTDTEIAEIWGVQRAWVAKQRARHGVLRLRKDKRAWTDEDFEYIAEMCEAIGRTPGAFVGEFQSRKGYGKRRKGL